MATEDSLDVSKNEAPEPETPPERNIAPDSGPEPKTAPLPDYLTSPDAVSADTDAQWRFGKAPNYANTRRVWAEEKKANHAAGSLPELVENLVKNWEIEASFKTRLSEWRTIDHENYTFAMNGEAPQTAEHMLKCGTYNAIIQSNEYYCPLHSDFASSHKTFKRMMPTFAWEVMEVYSGPPKVAFRWRHWGVMKNDYVGFNDKGEKVTAKAHGGPIEIFGFTTASVDDKVRLQNVDTYMDPLQMFRQIAPGGIVNKQPMNGIIDHANGQISGPAHQGVASASDVRQPILETTTEPTSSLNTCPFIPTEHMAIDSSGQQPDAALVGIVGTDANNPVEMADVKPHSISATSNGTAATAGDVKEFAPNPEPTESESRDKGMDLSAQDQPVVAEDTISKTQDTHSAVAADKNTTVENSIRYPEPGDNNGMDETTVENSIRRPDDEMDLNTSATQTTEEQMILSPDEIPFPMNGNATLVQDSGTILGLRDVLPTTSEAQDMNTLADPAAHIDQENIEDSQAGRSLVDTPEPAEQRAKDDWQAPPMSEICSSQDIHPYPKDVEEDVQPDAGEAVAASPATEETQKTHEEMGTITPEESEKMNIE